MTVEQAFDYQSGFAHLVRAMIRAGSSAGFTCSEMDQLVILLERAGMGSEAFQLFRMHAESDDSDDHHKPFEYVPKVDVTAAPGECSPVRVEILTECYDGVASDKYWIDGEFVGTRLAHEFAGQYMRHEGLRILTHFVAELPPEAVQAEAFREGVETYRATLSEEFLGALRSVHDA